MSGPVSANAGTAGSYTVTAKDAFGNTATGYLGTVHFTSSDSQASLPADYAFTSGDAGVKTFSVTLKTAGNQTVAATDTVTPSITGTSPHHGLRPRGRCERLDRHCKPVDPARRRHEHCHVTVTLKDQYGNPVAGKAVAVSATGSATLSSGGTGTSDAAGVATFTSTDTTPETVTYSATGDSVSLSQQASVIFSTGVLDHIVLSPSNASISSDGGSQAYTVTGYDATNHSLGDLTSTSTFTITPDGSCVNATATCSAIVAGAHTVTAHNSGFTDTATLTVDAGLPDTATSTITASPASVVADNTTSTITVRLKDAAGNDVPTSGGVVALNSSLAGSVLSAVTDNGNGTYTATVKSTVAGTTTITGTLGAAALASTTSVTFVPGPATHLVVSAPGSATAGTSVTVSVTAKDAFGNTATGYLGTVHFTSTDGSATLPGNYGFVSGDNGVNTFPVTFKTAGSQTVTATDTLTGTINGTTGGVGVNPGPVSQTTSTMTASPASVPADNSSTSTVNVTLKDAYGNIVPGKTVTLGAGAGSSNWSPATDITNGSGVASFAVWDNTVENVVYNAVDTSDALPLTDTATVAFTAGPITSIVLNPANATVAAGVGQLYHVRGYDSYGHDLGDVTGSSTLTIVGGTCVGSTCSANVAGTHSVQATDGALTAFANLTVTPGPASAAASTITASPTSLTADGVSTSTITVQLKDQYFNNVTASGGIVNLSATGSATLSANPAHDNGDGTYTATLTAPNTAGTSTITGTLGGTAIGGSALVTFGAAPPGPASGATSTITASPGTIVADGTSTSTITVQLKDAAGTRLTSGGDDVELSASNGTLVPAAPLKATDNNDGTYTATLTSPASAGSASITGTVNGATITHTTTVNFSAGPPGAADATTSTITASPTTIVGDGTSTSIVTVQLKDASGTSLSTGGDTVHLATSSGTISPDPATDNHDGTYTATLTSSVGAGTANITGTLNGAAMTNTASVTFTAPGSPPALVAATATGSTLTLTYDQALDATSVPAVTDFSISQNTTLQGTPTGVSVSGTTVTVSLAAPVNPGDIVTVSYTGTAIKNLTGQPAPALTNAPVTVGGVPLPRPARSTAPAATSRTPPAPPASTRGPRPRRSCSSGRTLPTARSSARSARSPSTPTTTRAGMRSPSPVTATRPRICSRAPAPRTRPRSPAQRRARTRSTRSWTTATTHGSTSMSSSRSSARGSPGSASGTRAAA